VARGKKRMWAGVTLVGFAVLVGAGVIASRWRGFAVGTTEPNLVRGLVLRGGEIEWEQFKPFDPTMFASKGLEFEMWRLDAPSGPRLTLEPDTVSLHQSYVASYVGSRDGHGYIGRLLAYSRTNDGKRFRLTAVAWPIPVVFLIAGVVPLWSGWRVRRRVRSGGCLRCGYDLSATPAPTPCPECGAQRLESETGRSLMNAPRTS
jgi:hypothetical protein